MRSVSTLVLLTVAASAGAAVYFYPDIDELALSAGRHAAPAAPASTQVAVTAAAPSQPSQGQPSQGPRVFSAQTPLYGSTVPAPVPAQRPARAGQVAESAVVGTAPIMRPGTSGIATSSTERSDSTSGPQTKEELMRTLAIALHKELKRVGCYAGDASSEWTAASKKAMRTFLDRVNAKLPIEHPDQVLLTMVKGHPSDSCGKECPVGQVAADDGKCMVRRTIARAPAPSPTVVAKEQPVASVAAKEPAETKPSTRGSVATFVTEVVPPVPAPVPATRTPEKVAQASSWTTEIAPATVETVAPGARPAPSAPLPGRMTLGAVAPAPISPPSVTGRTGSADRAPAQRAPVPKAPVPKARVAAATADTPNAAAGEEPVPKKKSIPPAPIEVRPAAQPQARPQPAPQRKVVEKGFSGGVSSYTPPTYRAPPSRDWKQSVFTSQR